MACKTQKLKELLKKNASTALTKQLLHVPVGGKKVLLFSGDRSVSVFVTASPAASYQVKQGDSDGP